MVIFVVMQDFGTEGLGEPIYVGIDPEKACRAMAATSGQRYKVQKWENGKLIETFPD